jgi:hypothetical protein
MSRIVVVLQVTGKQQQFCLFKNADVVVSSSGWVENGQLSLGRTVCFNARLAPPHVRQALGAK